MPKKLNNYTLVELLLTITIIGIVSTIVVTQFSTSEQDANSIIRDIEMTEIQKAFIRFYDDCAPSDTELLEVGKYGLWCLTQAKNPHDLTTPWGTHFDSLKNKGWRGPYINAEGSITIKDPATNPGQVKASGGTIKIPVILNPQGYHYRVLIPKSGPTTFYKNIVLVDPGSDGVLDTSETVTLSQPYITASGNDTVIQLLPRTL